MAPESPRHSDAFSQSQPAVSAPDRLSLSSHPVCHTARPPSTSSSGSSHPQPDRHPIMRKNSRGQLMPPLQTRNFAISPPPSPPVGWVSTLEDGPNMVPHASDLLNRLQSLAVGPSGHCCVYAPEYHYVDSEPEDSHPEDGSSSGHRPRHQPPRSRVTPHHQEQAHEHGRIPPTVRNGFLIPSIFVIPDADGGDEGNNNSSSSRSSSKDSGDGMDVDSNEHSKSPPVSSPAHGHLSSAPSSLCFGPTAAVPLSKLRTALPPQAR